MHQPWRQIMGTEYFPRLLIRWIVNVLKLDINWVEKKQSLSYDKNTFMNSIVNLESISFKYCFWRTAWKVSKYGVFSGPYFPAFGLNTERYSSRSDGQHNFSNTVVKHFAFMLEDCLQNFDFIHLDYLILVEIMHHQNELLFLIFLNLYITVGSISLIDQHQSIIQRGLLKIKAIFIEFGAI